LDSRPLAPRNDNDDWFDVQDWFCPRPAHPLSLQAQYNIPPCHSQGAQLNYLKLSEQKQHVILFKLCKKIFSGKHQVNTSQEQILVKLVIRRYKIKLLLTVKNTNNGNN
jgi:hypothetical protein